jgi:hypothetical protein
MAVVFEILGTPSGFDFYLKDADGHLWDMGSEAPTGELTVTCPTLAKTSSTNGDPPTIEVEVFRNGESWQQGCGTWAADGPAVYRAEVRITPHHLYDFLGEDPEPWIKSYPWIYSNAIRAGY